MKGQSRTESVHIRKARKNNKQDKECGTTGTVVPTLYEQSGNARFLFCRAKIYGIRPVVPGSANGKKDEYPGIARALSKRRTKYANEADDCQDA